MREKQHHKKERKIQIGKHGARYEWRVSKNTHKRYKKYLMPATHTIRPQLAAVKGLVFIPNR